MKEKLMSDNDIRNFIKTFEKQFEFGIIKDYKGLKSQGEEFLKTAYSIHPGGVNEKLKLWISNGKKKSDRKSLREFLFDDVKYRIFLGIGIELLIKAAFVKEGYIVNSYRDSKKENRLINNGKPEKLGTVKEYKLSKDKTHNISFFIKHINMVFPSGLLTNEEFNTYIRKGLEIARIWRNKEVHTSWGRHKETVGEDEAIKTAMINIYDKIFNEKQTFENIMKGVKNGSRRYTDTRSFRKDKKR